MTLLVSHHLTPPRLRICVSMHLVCFWPSPTSRARREHQLWPSEIRWWVGIARSCVCRRRGELLYFLFGNTKIMTLLVSPHSTPPRLSTGETMHLVCFWPSPTSRAWRERQRGASGVRWWVRMARSCVCRRRGELLYFLFGNTKMTLLVSPHSTPPRLSTGESMHLVCFWPSPTSMTRRERQQRASGVRWWVGTARFCVQEGCFFRIYK
jgi:hypothetical protein